VVANDKFDELLKNKANNLSEVAAAYRRRRGRHPLPYFDKWFEFASSRGRLVIEDIFDQIYRDIEPFWGMDGECQEIRIQDECLT
jgi:hypothetical protein